MKNKAYHFNINIAVLYSSLLILILFLTFPLNALTPPPSGKEIDKNIEDWRKVGKIPGLTLVIVRTNEPDFIKGYGYANLETKMAVAPDTLFELGSCSKAFTGLAALQLEKQGLINLDSHVSDHFHWFNVSYKGQQYKITLRQLLHHTSGLPWKTFGFIPTGNEDNALEQTVRNVSGIELSFIPGESYEYNSINYDIFGAVIEKITGKSFEVYMEDYLFSPLGLTGTFVGIAQKKPLMATGYKTGFFQPREYTSPPFRGNNPSAYVVSNGKDIARWLKIQLGMVETDFADLVQKSQEPDLTVSPSNGLTSYAMGWNVHPYRNSEISHGGLNPNFTSYIILRPKEKIGVAVLANSNSSMTDHIGNSVMRLLTEEKTYPIPSATDKVDSFCSIISFVLGLYVLIVILMILARIIGALRGKCTFKPLTLRKMIRIGFALLGTSPFLLGIYLIPQAIRQLPWDVILVWAPFSFKTAMILLVSAIGISYIQFFISLIYPTKNKYRNELPLVGIISILSGLAGTAVLFIITTSFFSDVGLGYLLYYFGLTYLMNVGGTKIAQTKMINISNNIALDLRVDLINKLFTAKYQNFEKIHDGRIFTTLNGDTGILAGSAGLIISSSTSMITLISGFIYMTTISILSTLIVIAVVIILILYYRFVSIRARVFLEEARDSQNTYMSLLNGMTRGYKELSIHRLKKYDFKKDLILASEINCEKSVKAGIKFLNANIIGDSIAMIVLGILSIVISRVITGVNVITLISFVMVLLYLLGPIRAIVNIIPNLTRIKVSWDRIKEFVKDIDWEGDQDSVKKFIKDLDRVEKKETIDLSVLDHLQKNIEHIKVDGLFFEYEGENGNKPFSVGPIDFQVNKGEAMFITGGNGSGKTTVAKLITGLYKCEKGNIKINHTEVENTLVGEYFSTIYSNYHLFEKIYGINIDGKEAEIEKSIKLLDLEKKVTLKDGAFSTLNLSGGQRKRLALLQCWLEDRPIYLFDEVAADQDPEFRKFFYHELLVKMKEKGKIIIAITHDDHYFDVADKIIKMDMGKIDMIEKMIK